jgi:uncharacterized protein
LAQYGAMTERSCPWPPATPPRALWAHIAPFVLWILFMLWPASNPALRYAAQSAIGLALLLTLRPWTFYPALNVRRLPLAFATGVLVFLIWVLPEFPAGDTCAKAQEFYLRYGIRPFGVLPKPATASPYAPELTGWALALTRLAGSAFVIAVIEEFFWRGFLYRWLVSKDFLQADLARIHWPVFAAVALVFGLEHDRWLAGLVAGFAYGAFYVRTRDIWATAAAHVTTNFLLGLYVLAAGAYHFW